MPLTCIHSLSIQSESPCHFCSHKAQVETSRWLYLATFFDTRP